MDPEALSAALLAVVTPLAEARRPGSAEGLTAADLPLERPKNRDHGDWASNAALKLAKIVGANPREFAAEIAEGLKSVDGIAEVAGNYPSKGGVGERAAWFGDSEGNVLGIGQAMR